MRIAHSSYQLVCIVTILVAYALYLSGYLTFKRTSESLATHDKTHVVGWNDSYAYIGKYSVPPKYERLIIVLIDALRADFVLPLGWLHSDAESVLKVIDNDMPRMMYVEKNILNGKATAYFARAHPPTVTMPRIKALTTGSIPGFVDLVKNFDSYKLIQDNLISQLYSADKSIVFYGDDTWLNLFPEQFKRSEGTTSFFVTDYTEVDNNVTRHLDTEMSAGDWDVMILHYLGLDHIGHTAGPFSALVPTKLEEMDAIVEQIHHNMMFWDKEKGLQSLLLVCGDHGMSDHGGHGGSSISETAVPLVFIPSSDHLHPHTFNDSQREVLQIDLVPTLALLLGLPIPTDNLGIVLHNMLTTYTTTQQLQCFYTNAQQILQLYQQVTPKYSTSPAFIRYQHAKSKHESLMKDIQQRSNTSDAAKQTQQYVQYRSEAIMKDYRLAMEEMRATLIQSLTQYDMYAICVACVMIYGVLICLLSGLYLLLFNVCIAVTNITTYAAVLSAAAIAAHIVVCTNSCTTSVVCTITWQSLIVYCLVAVLVLSFVLAVTHVAPLLLENMKKDWRPKPATSAVTIAVLLHTLSLASSSFVEEEHQTFYFYTTTIQLVLMYACTRCSSDAAGYAAWRHSVYCVAMVMLGRLQRAWNRTGDKWSHLPDVGDWLNETQHVHYLSLLTACSLLVSYIMLTSLIRPASTYTHVYKRVVCVGVLCTAYMHKAATGVVLLPYVYNKISRGLLEARAAYVLIGVYVLFSIYMYILVHLSDVDATASKKTAHDVYTDLYITWYLLSVCLSQAHNITLLTTHLLQQYLLHSVLSHCTACSNKYGRHNTGNSNTNDKYAVTVAWIYICMAQTSFFYQGNSNSLSTIDVSAGYIGLDSYEPVLVGLLLAVATYCGPVLWILALLRYVTSTSHPSASTQHQQLQQCNVLDCDSGKAIQCVSYTLCISRAVPVAFYTVIATIQRYHLFVWTVFSPKLLYEGVVTLLYVFVAALLLVLHR